MSLSQVMPSGTCVQRKLMLSQLPAHDFDASCDAELHATVFHAAIHKHQIPHLSNTRFFHAASLRQLLQLSVLLHNIML